ncbi:MAG: porin family protein [Saprospiraceae bacterium]
MKNLMLIFAALFVFQTANAQVKFGLRAGLNTTDITTDQIRIKDANDLDALGISIANANYGVHFGAVIQAQIGKRFFLQPEIQLSSNSIDYKIENFGDAQTYETILRENYQYMDIPIMAGLKFGPLRLQAGPVAHKFLYSNSDLTDISGYDPQFEDWTWGYQTGVGLDIWRFMIDVKYEGSFDNQSDHFNFFGKDYNFDKTPGRFVATLGYTF